MTGCFGQSDERSPRHYESLDDPDARNILHSMEVDVFEPSGRKEENMADAMFAFSSFVLYEDRDECKTILESHMGRTVGALQGGNDEEEIYRVVISDDENGACCALMNKFRASSKEAKNFANLLTPDRFEEYMLGMCDKRSVARSSGKCNRVNNIMFILTFGETIGQVRHIDKMNPNLQICLYMSSDCPSTIVYNLEEPGVTNGTQLVELWEENRHVPDLIKFMLSRDYTTRKLSDQRHTKSFSFWGTIDSILRTFGKLYRPVSSSVSFRANPGTTLIAGGNEVHAGPPTKGPRMFAFAVGIPGEEDENASDVLNDDDIDSNDGNSEDNDGEIQYCPSLLHTDLMCILFISMEIEFNDRIDEHEQAKCFLLEVLVEMIEDYPQETYERLLPDDRSELRDWLGNIARAVAQKEHYEVRSLLRYALQSRSIFYPPDSHEHRASNSKKERRLKRRLKREKAKCTDR